MDRKFTDVFGKLGFPTLRKVLSEYRKVLFPINKAFECNQYVS